MRDFEREQIEARGIFTGSLSQVGQVFGIKVGSGWTRGRFIEARKIEGFKSPHSNYRRRTVHRFVFVNMKTGREVLLKSKLKIAGRIKEAEDKATPEVKKPCGCSGDLAPGVHHKDCKV